MLKIYNTHESKLHEVRHLGANGWVSLIDPSEVEVNNVATHFSIPTDLIESALDLNERARLQQKDGALLIVTNLSHRNESDNAVPYGTMPLGIIVTTQTVLTVSRYDHPIFEAMLNEPMNELIGIEQTRFIYRLLQLGADHFIDSIEVVDRIIDGVEEQLQRSIKNREVFDLLNNNKSLIAFANGLKSNAQLFRELSNNTVMPSHDQTDKMLLDIRVETEQAEVMSATHNANLRNLMDAYSAAIENNLSLVVQYLSIYVIFLAIPMGMAGIYGMNTPLPIQNHPYALALLIIIAIAVAGVIAYLFKQRRII